MTCNNLYLLPKGKKKDAEAALIAAKTPRSSLVEVVASTSTLTDPVTHHQPKPFFHQPIGVSWVALGKRSHLSILSMIKTKVSGK